MAEEIPVQPKKRYAPRGLKDADLLLRSIDRNLHGEIDLAGPLALAADGAKESAQGVEDLDIRRFGVKNINPALIIDDDLADIGDHVPVIGPGRRDRQIFLQRKCRALEYRLFGIVEDGHVALFRDRPFPLGEALGRQNSPSAESDQNCKTE